MCLVPQELAEMIIDTLEGDHETLKATSLVCRSWVAPSRRNLFRHIYLPLDVGPRKEPSNPVHRLATIFKRSPRLARQVRSLHLSMGIPPKRRIQQNRAARMLAKLTGLRTLKVTPSPLKVRVAAFSRPLWVALRSTLASELVTDVTIDSWIFQNASQFFDLLGRTPRPLPSLTLRSLTLEDPHHLPHNLIVPAADPVVIETLCIHGCCPIDISSWLSASDRPIHVKQLSLGLVQQDFIEIANLFASSVEKLWIADDPFWGPFAHTVYGNPDPDAYDDDAELMPLVKLRSICLASANPDFIGVFEDLSEANVIENITIVVYFGYDFLTTAKEQQLDELLCEPDNYPSLKLVTLNFVVEFPTADQFRYIEDCFSNLVAEDMICVRCPDGTVFNSQDIPRKASPRRSIVLRPAPAPF